MTEKALGERAVETLNDGSVSVNFSEPMKNIRFVVFHFHFLVTVPMSSRPGSISIS